MTKLLEKILKIIRPGEKPGTSQDKDREHHESRPAARPRSKEPAAGPRTGNKARSKPGGGPPRKKVPWNPEQYRVKPAEGKVRFHDLGLPDQVFHAVADLGFEYCTPIQAQIMPGALEGKDAFGRAQTGTGKTAAFIITVLTRMLRQTGADKRKAGQPRVLVLAPTRELVIQIAEEAKALAKYTRFSIVSIFGGMDYEKQRRRLQAGPIDIMVATPGRLLDFKRNREVDLSKVETLIIDEADRMLDMGFIPDVRRIIYSTPHKTQRQTMLFSATLTEDVRRLASQWTKDPLVVEIEPEHVAADTVEQQVYIVTNEKKWALLYNIITRKKLERVIVFCNRKDETRYLAGLFARYGINCAVLSGDIRQRKRLKTLEDFKAGRIKVLVATDVAGRGIHIEGMDHVINYTLPRDPEDYVHRIGRTGRAGVTGTSISFADEDDSFFIPPIEELIGRPLPCIQPDEQWLKLPKVDKKPRSKSRRRRPRKRYSGRGRGGRRPKSGAKAQQPGSRG